MQAEHKQWLDAQYPNQPPHIPAAGLVEEAGELLHAILKLEQHSLWGADARYPLEKLEADAKDAVGDCAIYVCSLCNSLNWNFSALLASADAFKHCGFTPLMAAVALVEQAALCVHTPYQSKEVIEYVRMLKYIATRLCVNFDAAVTDTWNKVKQRTRKCV